MPIRHCFHAILLCLMPAALPVFAFPGTPVPDSLMYSGMPVDSLCFANPDTKINLKRCGAAWEKYRIIDSHTDLNKKGYIGYDWADTTNAPGAQGFSYYRYFKAGNNQFWIYSINNGGGSGNFTNLYLVKRLDANTLSVKNIAGGDRCNGGIQDVSEKNAVVTFSVNLTPYDLVALSHVKLNTINAYDDLAACAACCAGKAFYTVDKQLAPKFDYVNLDSVTQVSDLPDQGKYQTCFNNLFVTYVNKQKNHLTQTGMDEFATQFKASCLPGQTGKNS